MKQSKIPLEDIFFLKIDYSDYSSIEFPCERYVLIPLEEERKTISESQISELIKAYNIAKSRIEEVISKKTKAIFFNIKHAKGDTIYYISKEMPEIYDYIHRISEIRKFIIGLYPYPLSVTEQESYLSSVFGSFNEISFLTDIFYKCGFGINNRSHQKILYIMQRQYIDKKVKEENKVR